MAKRKSIGDNPLDLLIPQKKAAAKKARSKGAAARTKASAKTKSKKTGAVTAAPKTKPAPAAIEAGEETKEAPPVKPKRKTAKSGSKAAAQAPEDAASGKRAAETPEEREHAPETRAKATPDAPISPPRRSASAGQYLTFFLAGEEYGVGILDVKEIIEYHTLTTVPATPPWVRGVINLRGSVVPVIDLAVKFGLPEVEVTNRTCIVIVEVELEAELAVMGILADAVSQVVEFDASEIESAPAFGTQIHVDYLLGMGKIDERFVLLLNKDRALSLGEMMVLAESSRASEEDADEVEAAQPPPP